MKIGPADQKMEDTRNVRCEDMGNAKRIRCEGNFDGKILGCQALDLYLNVDLKIPGNSLPE
jgi:hypothetical protein